VEQEQVQELSDQLQEQVQEQAHCLSKHFHNYCKILHHQEPEFRN
jgi:hypothetical protein